MNRWLVLMLLVGLSAAVAVEPDPEAELRALVAAEDWAGALAVLPQVVDPAQAPAPWMALAVQVSSEAGRPALARLWCERGRLRFPDDRALRRWHARLLLDAGERSRAAALAQEELASHPADADAWRLLASVSDGALARAAWEAALALEPDHSPSRRALVVHLLAAGQGAAALATAESLDDPLLSARCAWAAGDHELTRRFLAKAPAHPDRERLALLLAVESDDRAAARTAAEALLRLPDLVDRTAVLMQLAGVSEGITAENALRQAHAADPMRGVLPLARWLIAAERSAEARRLLDDHLASRPGDGYAWRLRHWLAD